MNVHRPRLDLPFESPDALEQPVARQDTVPVLDKEAKQLELALGESHGRSRDAHRHRVVIYREGSALITEVLLQGGLRRPPQDSADSRDKFAQAERLRYIIVGAQFQPCNAVRFACTRRHHDDRNARAGRAGAQQAAHLETVDEGQVKSSRTRPGGSSITDFNAAAPVPTISTAISPARSTACSSVPHVGVVFTIEPRLPVTPSLKSIYPYAGLSVSDCPVFEQGRFKGLQ